jgi:serine/threonine-protein kinase
MAIESGETIGSVVLRHKIAEGGMGAIWAAEHVALGREVAVKFLAARIANNTEALQRFSLEARTLARISSPHTPQVFDHGVRADGTPYIVMELIDGTELWEWVAARGNMSVRQVGRLTYEVLAAGEWVRSRVEMDRTRGEESPRRPSEARTADRR